MSTLSNKYGTMCAVLFSISVLVAPAQAQMVYEIEIIESEAVSSDIDMIETILSGAEGGGEITGSVRRLINTVNGEFTIVAEEQVNDQNEILSDDGTYAILYDGDIIKVKPIRKLPETVIFRCGILFKPNKNNAIPSCDFICTSTDGLPPICNSVPPKSFKMK